VFGPDGDGEGARLVVVVRVRPTPADGIESTSPLLYVEVEPHFDFFSPSRLLGGVPMLRLICFLQQLFLQQKKNYSFL
jgi:hypothetical protein